MQGKVFSQEFKITLNYYHQIIAVFVNLVFLGQAFTIMLVYIWSRRNPYVRMNFFGLMNFQAPYLPWVLLGFSLMLGNSVVVDLMGKISSCCVKLDLGLFNIPRRSKFLLANDCFFTRSYKFIRLNGKGE